jgi:hypothetical protein
MPGVVDRAATTERAAMLSDDPPVLSDYDAAGIGMNLDRPAPLTPGCKGNNFRTATLGNSRAISAKTAASNLIKHHYLL